MLDGRIAEDPRYRRATGFLVQVTTVLKSVTLPLGSINDEKPSLRPFFDAQQSKLTVK